MPAPQPNARLCLTAAGHGDDLVITVCLRLKDIRCDKEELLAPEFIAPVHVDD